MSLEWKKCPINKQLARELRVSTHGITFEDHSFIYADLKELWAVDNEHVVCTHDTDQTWQYWHQIPEGGWKPISIHDTKVKAQRAAEERNAPAKASESGTYVMARFTPESRWMRTRVLSKDGVANLTAIYTRLGCSEIKTEEVT